MVKWIAVAISISAFAFSLTTFVLSIRRDRRVAFLNLFEKLIEIDQQRGRGILYERVHSVDDVLELHTHDRDSYHLMGRAISTLEVFALYANKGYINKRLAMEELGHTFAKAAERIEYVVAFRGQHQGAPAAWPHIRRFGRECLAHSSVRDPNDDRWRPPDLSGPTPKL